MEVTPIKTHIVSPGENILALLDKYLADIRDGDIVTITSKIIAVSETRLVKITPEVNKKDLIKKEADLYIDDPRMNKYNIMLTVKNSSLVASAGIDESNGNGYYIFWPENPMQSAARIWQYLRSKRQLQKLGIVVTDSKTTPLRWGVTGFGIAWCGFKVLKDYTNLPDIYGRPFVYEQTNVMDSLAAVGAYVMGEGNEQTPLAVIRGAPHVEFTSAPPTDAEINGLKIKLADDVYASLTDSALWQKKADKT